MIDFNLIHQSIEYYKEYNFQRIETPWLVSSAADSITKPEWVPSFTVESKGKNLIGSGEQAFLYLYLKEQLPKGRLQTTTPCFRDDAIDLTHTKHFIKNELIDTNDVSENNLTEIVECAEKFFNKLFIKDVDILPTSEGYDIMMGDIELGSYGIRSCEFLDWIYATGCAEPRTSIAINIHK